MHASPDAYDRNIEGKRYCPIIVSLETRGRGRVSGYVSQRVRDTEGEGEGQEGNGERIKRIQRYEIQKMV